MKISASIFAQNQKTIDELVAELQKVGVTMLHVDWKGESAVIAFLEENLPHLTLPLDVHLIHAQPQQFFHSLTAIKAHRICLQFEEIADVDSSFFSLPAKKGMAITTSTLISTLGDDLIARLDFVMLMCTTPGESGGKFQKANFQKINQLKYEYPNLSITIDGGVNSEVAFILRLLGVDTIVSGSYLMERSEYGANMLNLLRPYAGETFCVKDFMVSKAYLPILKAGTFSFKEAVQKIEDFKSGYVLIEDENGRFCGIVSNADVRKTVLKHWTNLDGIAEADFVNATPFSVNENATVREMLKTIEAIGRVILFLPVINNNNELTGLVPLNNLAKG